VLLPTDVTFTGKGSSPLATSPTFVTAKCPKCGGEGRRETDTIDTFMDSSWYLFRYISPREENAPFVSADVNRWFPVDQYIGGIEHACGHLIFVRFMTKALHDMGLVAFDEPIEKLFTQGMIYMNGSKMSKSKGNVVPPDELIAAYGADTERLYTLFMGPPDRDAEWSAASVEGCHRFLNRIWTLAEEWPFDTVSDYGARLGSADLPEEVLGLHRKTHQTIRKVTRDLEGFHFNTAVAAVMELANATRSLIDGLAGRAPAPAERYAICEAVRSLVLLLGPMVPHLGEELWERAGGRETMLRQPWPSWDEAAAAEDTVTIAVQVNGKLRGDIAAPRGATQEDALELARASEKLRKHLEGGTLRRVIYIQDRLLNLVVKQ
jgi:leucyl-tRNA synthetase